MKATSCGALDEARTDRLWRSGNSACAGCGMSLGLQWLDHALQGTTPSLVVPACCAVVTAGRFPDSAFGAPAIGTTFGSSAAVASGVSRVHLINGESNATICWAGDGGTLDIGMASLSGAAERNEDVIYICYDNEIYGNTGSQRSSSTPRGAWTSTTVAGKVETKKDIMAIMAAHRIPYAATLSLAHYEDFMHKIIVAKATPGFRFLLLLSPCPAGWKSDPADTLELSRLAVASGLFPLYEVFDGRRYRINARPVGAPLEDYLSRQKRFRIEPIDIEALRIGISEQWAYLDSMASSFPAASIADVS